MTFLCVSIFAGDVTQARRDAALAAEAGADLVEYRIDTLASHEQVKDLVSRSSLPCLVTCRATWEGGQCDLPDADRFALLATALDAGAAYVDVELEAFRRSYPEFSSRLILSAHDFQGRPERLYNLLSEMNTARSDVAKIVWTARTLRDNLEAFEILRLRHKPTIALCMGEAGMVSRILAKKFGAFLTFAAPDHRPGTAPGQVTVSDMKRLYRWDKITPRTKIYGVVAKPVAHSMSPAIHNAAFDAIDYDGLYLPLLVEPGYESFKAFMESFLHAEGLDLSGLSVTLPHKENALRYLKEKGARIEPLAERIGAVNTIVIDSVQSLKGLNTDYAAILDTITDSLRIRREDLAEYRVAVLGAGGTGRTAVAALAHYGATVVVYNRTRQRADALAGEFSDRGNVSAADMEELRDGSFDVILNTTSVGMHPNTDASPFDGNLPKLTSDTLVFDAIYNPPQTKLLAQAKQAGAKTASGVEMFLRQAAAQFQAWTGQPAPVDVMRSVIEKKLIAR